MNTNGVQRYAFGSFTLDVESRTLARDGEPVQLTPKAFDALLLLVENHGRVLDKEEMLRLLWPDRFVEEINLTVHISALRKALGESGSQHRYIETIPKRGYRFSAEIVEQVDESVAAEAGASSGQFKTTTKVARRASLVSIAKRGIIPALVILAGIVFLIRYIPDGREPGSPAANSARTIAVLPFKLLTPEGEEHLGIGVTDAVINKLSRIEQITVRPTSSVLKYVAEGVDPREAGRKLGVESLLTGVIQRSAGTIRVSVQLVRVTDGATLWGDTFEQTSTGIFAMQDRIAAQVAESLAIRLTGDQRRDLARNSTSNPEAYEMYLRGIYCVNKQTPEFLRKAIDYFEKAVVLDPGYAAAYASISDTYTALGFYGAMRPAEAFPKARNALNRALEIDDTLAEAHTARAFVKMQYERDWSGAEQAFKRAIETNPNYLPARIWYAWWLLLHDRLNESRAEMKQAYQIDPVTRDTNGSLALYLFYTREYESAVEQYRKAIAMEPRSAGSHNMIGLIKARTGLHEQARSELKLAEGAGGARSDFLAYAYAVSGKRAEAVKILAELEQATQETYVSPYTLARICVGLGETDKAFEWLEKSYAELDQKLIWLKMDPTFDAVRGDTRFAAILRRMGLEPGPVLASEKPHGNQASRLDDYRPANR
jgi:DNA-binding winged helix-turn-helix (wHTH) protein/TolB-like protein/Tfp pilus assembly protein PilF